MLAWVGSLKCPTSFENIFLLPRCFSWINAQGLGLSPNKCFLALPQGVLISRVPHSWGVTLYMIHRTPKKNTWFSLQICSNLSRTLYLQLPEKTGKRIPWFIVKTKMQPVFLTLVRKRGQFAIQIWREERVKNFIESLQHFRVEDRTQVFGETKVKHKYIRTYIHPEGKKKEHRITS